jgi:hypothetical protein
MNVFLPSSAQKRMVVYSSEKLVSTYQTATRYYKAKNRNMYGYALRAVTAVPIVGVSVPASQAFVMKKG